MPENIIIEVVGNVLGFALEYALLFWNEIVTWTYELFAFWASSDIIPVAIQSIEFAFMATSAISKDILTAVISSWELVKTFLLDAIVEILKSPESTFEWVKRIVTIIVKIPEIEEKTAEQPIIIDLTNRPIIIKRVSEEEIDWDRLPSSIRASLIRENKEKYAVNFLDTREKELNAMRMTE
jgi:hypothetical protein